MISVFVATFADSALVIPASALVFGYLLAVRHGWSAAAWAVALGTVGALTLAAKLLFHACGASIADSEVVSPSGHVSAAVVFYGSLALLFGSGRSAGLRRILGVGVVLFVVAVAISRVRTGAHSGAEVGIGCLIGCVGLAIFTRLFRTSAPALLPWRPALYGFFALLILIGGAHLEFEGQIGRLARRASMTLDVCTERDRADGGAAIGLPVGHAAWVGPDGARPDRGREAEAE